ncbi:MAG TPA: VWA domain-containing protein, partial [Vicinamibacterales bacterium]|nr:VWA domain-containing protein [Vicinamibacterales bacterium]
MTARRAYVVAIVLTLSTIRPAAQQPPAQTFRSGREVLTIMTSVRDGADRPLTDLRPEEFEVRIDGQPRRVLTAQPFGTDASRAIAATAAPIPAFTSNADISPGRLVVFAIDRDSIRGGGEKAAIDTAAKMLDQLSPSDAAGALGLPGAGIELTRDHAAVAAVIKTMTGMAPTPNWQHAMSWDEALAYERGDTPTIAQVIQRECPKLGKQGTFPPPDPCPPALEVQSREMLGIGRGHANNLLANLSALLDRLAPLTAPKHLVLLSGGLPYDLEMLPRYQQLAARAARSHVALFVVHLDQAEFDASDRGHFGQVFGGREYSTGLGTIASVTGGQFFMGVGRATGVFDRIASAINHFYQLGVESRPSDADGKSHRVEVKVSRASARVSAPAETAIEPAPGRSADDAIRAALAEPTDIQELPLELAPYVTHSTDPDKVRVIVAAAVPAASGAAPAAWGYVIRDDSRVVTGSQIHIDAPSQGVWSATASADVPAGRYHLRAAVVSADGRVGTLEIPLRVGLRMAGAAYASDLILGTTDEARLQPRARLRQDERGIAMIELSSGESLADTGGTVQLTRAGGTEPALRRPLVLRTRADDKSIVVAEAVLDLSAVPPGTYTASAILTRGGTPVGRVSRVIDVLPGTAPAPTPGAAPAPSAPAPAAPATAAREAGLDEVMARVGEYAAGYGQQASVIIGLEHYEQRLLSVTGSETSRRQSIAEFALVKTGDAIGWSGFRDVIEVDGRRVGNRQDRLQTLFKSGKPDAGEARRIADEGARFNLGPARRNFNEPTAALFFFMPSLLPRFAFTRKGESVIDGATVWEVEFKEQARPTLIRT